MKEKEINEVLSFTLVQPPHVNTLFIHPSFSGETCKNYKQTIILWPVVSYMCRVLHFVHSEPVMDILGSVVSSPQFQHWEVSHSVTTV